MAFKKNQRVTGRNTGREYRIESGPWPRPGGSVGYLTEQVGVGVYVLQEEAYLCPIVPRQGDTGHLSGYRFKWRIHHIDDKVVTLQAIGSTNGAAQWRAEAREYFNGIWRGDE